MSKMAEEGVRFGIPDGETDEDGWTFDGLDWVKWDDEDNCWVFDGEELAVKDEKNDIYVQRGEKLFMKDAETGQLYDEQEDGGLVPVDEEGYPIDELAQEAQVVNPKAEQASSHAGQHLQLAPISSAQTATEGQRKDEASPRTSAPKEGVRRGLEEWERAVSLGLLDDKRWTSNQQQSIRPSNRVERYTRSEYHSILASNPSQQ